MLFRKNNIPWNKGKSLSEENIIKIGYKGISKNTKKFIKNYAPLVKTKQNINFTEGTKLISIKNF